MSNITTTSEKTTKRISDEVFAEVERELAAKAEAIVPTIAVIASEPKSDKLNDVAKAMLPYVWTSALGVWVAGLMIMNSLIPIVQCFGVGLVVAGVLSSIVFAWRSREPL